jgi:hypothetical protein
LTGFVSEAESPDPARSVFRRVDHSRLISIILALGFPLVMIRGEQLLSYGSLRATIGMPMYRFGRFSPPIVGLAHRRPLEVCPSTDEEYARHTASQPQRTPRRLVRLVQFAADYHRTSRAIIMGPCSGGWIWQPGSSSHLYAQFARDAPIAWIFGRLGGSEVLIGLFVLGSALLGAFGVGRVLFYLSDSNLVVVAGLGAFAWAVTVLFGIFHLAVLYAAYGLLTCWLIACWNRRSPQRSGVTAVLLSGAIALHLCGYMVVAYSAAVGAIAVALFAMACSFVIRPASARALQLAAVALIVWIAIADCVAFSTKQLAPISALNFAGSGSFGEFALSTGFWTERPNPVSFPLGDPGVYAAYRAEPLVRDYANMLFEYQGFKAFGQALFRATVVRHPLTALASLFGRLFILIVRLPVLAQPIMRSSPTFIRTSQIGAVVTLLLTLAVLCCGTRWHLEFPLVAVPLWNTVGIESLTHIVHTHSSYHVDGMMQIAMLAPVLLLVAVRSRLSVWNWISALRRPAVLLAVSGAVALLAMWSYPVMRRELLTFDIWYPAWIGIYRTPLDAQAIEPAVVRGKLEQLRLRGENAPGSISSYGAWTMSRLADNVWVPESGIGEKLHLSGDAVARRRGEARALAAAYFRRAASEAPDNPWIQTFTDLWDQEAVARSYKDMLARHPDHPFATWWAYVLAARTSGPEQVRYADQFEQLTHKQLVTTAALRPGFAMMPAGGQPIANAADNGWTEVRLTEQQSAVVGATDAFGSNRVRLIVAIRVVSGRARATLVADTDQGRVASPEERPISDLDVNHYRVFRWTGASPARRMALQLQAAQGTAIVRIRDFYPVIENPHVDSLE